MTQPEPQFEPLNQKKPRRARRPKRLNLAMLMTWARMVMIPLVVVVLMLAGTWIPMGHANKIACVIFVIASITDALDGYLARNYGFATPMGAFLDPVADKLMVSAALIMLLAMGRIEVLLALIIIGREIAISALREWMAKVGESGRTRVNRFGKIKTISQMTAISLLLWHDPCLGIDIALVGRILAWIAAALTVYSMCVYLYAAGPYLNRDR